jgi:hypothetical protein
MEHTCRPAAHVAPGEPWQCRDCGRVRGAEPKPWERGEEHRTLTVARIVLVASVTLAVAAGYYDLPVVALMIAVPGVLCAVYVLWRTLRS